MDVTRNVILDLLPLYVADEVSEDTRALVEKYLETDPELAAAAKETAAMKFPEEIPVPLSKDVQMEALEQAKRLLFQRTIFWAGLIAFGLVSCLALAALIYMLLVSS
jgi:anti-sigma factor RsiW